MNKILRLVKQDVYEQCGLDISDFAWERESKAYHACQFKLNGKAVICRQAKITPKKSGQFVTIWKREDAGPIAPFTVTDPFEILIVNICSAGRLGQFVFPKTAMAKYGLLSTHEKEGKRAFRVYPEWETTLNAQARKSQKWQLNYFFEISAAMDLDKVKKMYELVGR